MGIPTQAPESFFAGDTVKWLVSDANYLPSDGWSMVADLASGSTHISTTATDNGDGRHLITVTTSDTGSLPAGDYSLAVSAQKAGERYTLVRSSLRVLPNLSSAADARSKIKQALDAIEAYLADSNNLQAASYSIAGRQLSRYSAADLIQLHNHYRALYKQEQDADRLVSGQKPRRRLLTRMS